MDKQRTFVLPPKMNSASLIRALKENFQIRSERAGHQRLTFFDTFDWRLYNNSNYLVQTDDFFSLYSFPDELLIAEQKWQKIKEPEFWWDFPEGSLKENLKSRIDLRALIELGSFDRNRQQLRILNDDQKTVVIADLEHVKSVNSLSTYLIYVRPIRGYFKDYTSFNRYLVQLGLNADEYKPPFRHLEFETHKPGVYSSKLRLSLSSAMTGREAMSQICMFLLDVAEQNLEGMKQDIDTEFLHDFRVSIRRTRAALSQIKGVYSTSKVAEFKKIFGDIGKSTNRLRDLDVYLLNKDYYYTLVPDIFKHGLDVLFTKLAKQRAYEYKKLVLLLDSDEFLKSLAAWRTFLKSNGKMSPGPSAEKPVLVLAQDFIYKQFTNVISQGKKIGKNTPDSKIHDLRIECKKLRYLMEFFASLFPEEDINYLIRQLKMLQDNLGDFNDLAVQQQEMQEYLQEVNWNHKTAQTITAALGGLIASLNNKQKYVRSQFFATFATFSSMENETHFEKLFNPENTKQERS